MSDTNLVLFSDSPPANINNKKPLHKKVVLKEYDTGQVELFPEDLEESISKFHIARYIKAVINKLNIDSLISSYIGGGTSAYHPRLLLSIWLLAFVYKTYSCRGVAKLLRENIVFKWLSGNTLIDFRTLNNFRLRLEKDIKKIFREVLKIALANKIILAKDIFIDHSKFEANANRYKVIWKKKVKNQIDKIESELEALFSYIARTEKAENKIYGDHDYYEEDSKSNMRNFTDTDFEDMISDVNIHLKNKEINHEDARNKKAKFRRLKVLLYRLKRYNYSKLLLGDRRRSYSKTDKDATAMLQKDGIIKPGYNEGVATSGGFVLDYSNSQTSGDSNKLIELVDGVEANTGAKIDSVTADSAYGSEENYQYLEDKDVKANVKYPTYHPEKTKKYQKKRIRKDQFLYDKSSDSYRCPNGKILNFVKRINRKKKTSDYVQETKIYSANPDDCSACFLKQFCTKGKARSLNVSENYDRLKTDAINQLKSTDGRYLSKRRGFEVETVFGHKKHNAFYRRYSLRGINKVRTETGMFYNSYNLEKLYRYFMKNLGSYFYGLDRLEAGSPGIGPPSEKRICS